MLKEFRIDDLARGTDPLAPPGQLSSSRTGPLYRQLINMLPQDGRLRRREGTVAVPNQPTFDDTRDRAVVLWAELTPNRVLMVTTREVLLGDVNWGWVDVTPVHEIGTVSITNGTDALTGVGTSWDTLKIAAGQLVDLPQGSGDWYVINSVNSDTSITLATNYTGTTLSGDNYTIRRQFIGGYGTPLAPTAFFYVILLDNLFLAGRVATGTFLSFGTTIAEGGVIKIPGAGSPDTLPTAPDPADSVYVTAGANAIEAGVDNLGYNWRPAGLAALPDGRLVMPIRFANLLTPTAGTSRVVYSSHLDTSVWTSTPAGFTDIADTSGNLTGVDRIGRDLLFHFDRGHEIGELTGQDEEPLRFYRTDSTVGCIGPRAHIEANGRVYFLGTDLNLRVFSGQSSRVVFPGVRKSLLEEPFLETPADNFDKDELSLGFLRFDPYREELSFYWWDGGIPPNADRTKEARFNLMTGDYSIHEYGPIFSATTLLLTDGDPTVLGGQDRKTAVAVLGGEGSSGLLWRMDQTARSDALAPGDAREPRAVLDYMDFGAPISYKMVQHIFIGYIADQSGTFNVEIRRDNQALEILSATVIDTNEREELIHLKPDVDESGRIYRIRFASDDGDTFVPELTKLLVLYEDVADIRAVSG